jgi:hypothetical protein
MIPSNPLPNRQRVTLIRPARVVPTGARGVPVTPPLGLASLGAVLLDAGHDVVAIDAIGEGLSHTVEEEGYCYQGLPIEEVVAAIDPGTTMVGISCMFSQEWPWIARLIAAIRERHYEALIVAGGEHITALAEFSLRDCPALDICAIGEGEASLADLAACGETFDELLRIPGLAFLDGDRFVQTPPRTPIDARETLPPPAWHLFPVHLYFASASSFGSYSGRSLPVMATRRSPSRSSNESMDDTLWTPRSPADIVDEIEVLEDRFEIENIDFIDVTMTVRKDWILEFCRELDRRRVHIAWQLPGGTRPQIIDDEVAAALYNSGCRHLVLVAERGLEFERAVHVARRCGLTVETSMVIGFPDETRADVLRSIAFAWRQAAWDVDATSFLMFAPDPTALFDELRAEGRVGAISRAHFGSLAAIPDPWRRTANNRHMSGLELAAWRLVGMGSFFALALTLHPAKLVRLVTHVVQNRCETILEQRLRGWLGLNAPVLAR